MCHKTNKQLTIKKFNKSSKIFTKVKVITEVQTNENQIYLLLAKYKSPQTIKNSSQILNDSFSKYAQEYKLGSFQGTEIVYNLNFIHNCIFDKIIVEDGLEVRHSVVKQLLETYKINIYFISSQHPELNCLIQRFYMT